MAASDSFPTQWRLQCPTCGRFIAADAVREVLDVFTYEAEGIDVMRAYADCGRCGRVEPNTVPMCWAAS